MKLRGRLNSPYHRMLREYDFLARYYDRIWAFYIRETTRKTLDRLEAPIRARVLDVGCGTGEMLRQLRMTRPSVTLSGIDPCKKMLALSYEKLGDVVDLRQGYAESLPYADDSFDAVISNSVFHYIREPRKALAEMARVLVPGGQLLITDWSRDYMMCRLCDRVLRLIEGAHVQVYSGDELRALLKAGGFIEIAVERYKINWLWGMMTARGRSPGPR